MSKKVPEDNHWYFGFSLHTHGRQKTLMEQLPTQIKASSEYTTNVKQNIHSTAILWCQTGIRCI
jgi:hypothetical protein